MWHKRWDSCVTSLPLEDDRIVGVQFLASPGQFVSFFQVYLPCSYHSIIDIFRNNIQTVRHLAFVRGELNCDISGRFLCTI